MDISDKRPSMCTCPDRHGPPDPRCPVHRPVTLTDDVRLTAVASGGYYQNEHGEMVRYPSGNELREHEEREYDIRTWALDAASRLHAGKGGGDMAVHSVVRVAKRLEEYLRGDE